MTVVRIIGFIGCLLAVLAIILIPLSCESPDSLKKDKVITDPAIVHQAYLRRPTIKAGEDLEVAVRWTGADGGWLLDKFDSRVEGNTVYVTPILKRNVKEGAMVVLTPKTNTYRVTSLKPGKYTVIVRGANGREETLTAEVR